MDASACNGGTSAHDISNGGTSAHATSNGGTPGYDTSTGDMFAQGTRVGDTFAHATSNGGMRVCWEVVGPLTRQHMCLPAAVTLIADLRGRTGQRSYSQNSARAWHERVCRLRSTAGISRWGVLSQWQASVLRRSLLMSVSKDGEITRRADVLHERVCRLRSTAGISQRGLLQCSKLRELCL